MNQLEMAFETPADNTLSITDGFISAIKSVAQISPCLYIKAGSKITVKNAAKSPSLLFSIDVGVNIPTDVCIADTGKFVSTLALMKTPTIEFNTDYMVISSAQLKSKFKWIYCERAAIEPWISSVSEIPVKSKPIMNFTLTKEQLSQFVRMSNTLGMINGFIESSESGIKLISSKTDGNPDEENFQINVSEVSTPTFKCGFKLTDIINDQNYDVNVYKDERCVNFKGGKVSYWVAMQS